MVAINDIIIVDLIYLDRTLRPLVSTKDFSQLQATLNQINIGKVLALGTFDTKWFIRLLPLKDGLPDTSGLAYRRGQGLVAYFPSNATLQNSFLSWTIELTHYTPSVVTISHSAELTIDEDRAEALIDDIPIHFHFNTSNYIVTHEGWLAGTCWSVMTNDWNSLTGEGTPLPADGNITISIYINGIESYSETLPGPLAPTTALIDNFTGLYDQPTFDGGRLLKRGEVPLQVGDVITAYISGDGFPGFGRAKLIVMMEHTP